MTCCIAEMFNSHYHFYNFYHRFMQINAVYIWIVDCFRLGTIEEVMKWEKYNAQQNTSLYIIPSTLKTKVPKNLHQLSCSRIFIFSPWNERKNELFFSCITLFFLELNRRMSRGRSAHRASRSGTTFRSLVCLSHFGMQAAKRNAELRRKNLTPSSQEATINPEVALIDPQLAINFPAPDLNFQSRNH